MWKTILKGLVWAATWAANHPDEIKTMVDTVVEIKAAKATK